jgi:hypothetical protein
MAKPLMIRRVCLANRAAAAEETVDDYPGVEQIAKRGKATLTSFRAGVGRALR